MDICNRVGGKVLFNAMAAILIVAAFGSGLTGTLGAARLLFGMGRDNVLPKSFLDNSSPERSTPTNNILLIGGMSFTGAVLLYHIGNAYEHAAELAQLRRVPCLHGCELRVFLAVLGQDAGGIPRLVVDRFLPLIGFLVCVISGGI